MGRGSPVHTAAAAQDLASLPKHAATVPSWPLAASSYLTLLPCFVIFLDPAVLTKTGMCWALPRQATCTGELT